jgi:hypothetical protein
LQLLTASAEGPISTAIRWLLQSLTICAIINLSIWSPSLDVS